MKLQILITQYNETEEVIKPLLDSIAIQQNVNFDDIGALIVNDGSNTFLSDDFLKAYPFIIEYHKEPHRGVSGARNACLDYATAEYVMFCDADDMFVNNCGLYVVFMNMDFDTLNSSFIEEARNHFNGQPIYVTHEQDSTFIHGKVHRRQYLIDKNIRWNEDLTIHEDSFFNVQCLCLTDKVKYCDTPFYLWKWRKDSVCRNDPKYMLKTYNNLIDSNDALVDEFIKRGIMDRAMYYTTYMVFNTYYTMNKSEWINQENKEHRDATEKKFAEYFKKHESLWNQVSIYDKVKVSDQVREKVAKEGMLLEAVTVFDWLNKIKGE